MTNLDCMATNCVYNDNKCCCKGDIEVKGARAKSVEETCCGSFVEQKNNRDKNAAATPMRDIEVSCEACNCEHNENHKCSAKHIGIAGQNACRCTETECTSFCCCE